MIIMIFIYCSNNNPMPPKILPNIPKTSFWIGGVDGGNWFNIRRIKNNIYYIEIYNDVDGSLDEKGYYKIEPGIESFEIFKAIINAYDGEKIILKNGSIYKLSKVKF